MANLPKAQPIKTAPRDGKEFWGICNSDAITMFWHPELKVFCSSFSRVQLPEGCLVNGKPYIDHSPVTHEPTRWLPIPAWVTGDEYEIEEKE